MEDSRVGRRYAQALFTTARKYDVVRPVESDLDAIVGLLENDREFRDFLIAPFRSREEKAQILERLFSDRVTALTMQVLRVMIEKRREEDIPAVRSEYIALRRESEGVVHAVVTSAEMLDDNQKQAVVERLARVLDKKIEADFEIDPLLIGGVRVASGNYVLDGSVRGALSKLREKLRYDLLKQQI